MVYKISCNRCKDQDQEGIYIGESGHSAFFRGKSHLEALRKRTSDSVLDRHSLEVHGGRQMYMKDFTMTVESFHSRPVSRLSNEGLSIASAARKVGNGEKLFLMNNKSLFISHKYCKTTK